jgi:hypothetical protein
MYVLSIDFADEIDEVRTDGWFGYCFTPTDTEAY